ALQPPSSLPPEHEMGSKSASQSPSHFTDALAEPLQLAEHVPLQLPEQVTLGAVTEQVPVQVPLQLPCESVATLHAPSHLPWHAPPPDALQDPEHVPVQVPSQERVAPAFALHSPLQETERVPPVHLGGFALKSHLTPPLHCAWQLALALIDASHFGGSA